MLDRTYLLKKERFRVVAAVHVLILYNNHVLLVRRYKTGYEDGKYSLVAGHIEGNETVLEAGSREAQEEVGVYIRPDSLEFAGVMHRKVGSERVDFFLKTSSWVGKISNKEPHKCDQLHWADMSNLPLNTVPYIRRAVANFQDNRFLDCYGW